ncbi:YhdP family protein [Aestuariirhabdus litorea]|uniref:TIGR02099 family protein n=1 Tax=Aestuariirhabdus litorea TaxID=2528527 RepID=A0A3P3VLS0_9GAMM|nr:YhdP family protein [Aestuariirhabdus litorea]RRJ83711.1 TIGR02099 family protein [Aestuariirhabdus litorea]RWW96933.1 TIGR02099 family protein [Endozoicomonadaceae bacterium GTF-13]
MMKRFALHLSRSTWFVALALALLLGAYLVAGRLLLPFLENYRGELEAELSRQLGAQVSIESLEGQFRGFNPALVAGQVTIAPRASKEGVSANILLASLSVELDFFGSLRARSPSVRELLIEGLELYLAENEEGQWSLAGWEPSAESGSEQPPLTEWLSVFVQQVERQDHIQLIDSRVQLQPWQAAARTIDRLQLDLVDLPQGKIQLELRGRVGFQQRLHLTATLEGDYSDLSQLRLNAYLGGDMLALGPLAREVLDPRVRALSLKPSLWLSWDGQRWVARGNMDVGRLQFELDGREQVLTDLGVELAADYRPGDQWRLWLQEIHFAMGGYQWPRTDLYLEGDTDGAVTLGVPELDLDQIKALLLGNALLSKLPLDLLSTLNPSGTLERVRLHYLPQQEDFEVSAHLVDVAVDAWRSAPSGKGINAFVRASRESGYIKLDSSQFTLGLTKLFREPWHYRKAQGFLYWEIADNQYSLMTENIHLEGDEGEVHGQFRLDIPFDERPIAMGLQAGIRNGDARFAGKYLPVGDSGLSEALVAWLDRGLVAGSIREGAFMMNGVLEDVDNDNDFSVGLFFDVEQATVDYAPDWPAAEEVDALVVINDSAVRVDSTSARIWGAPVESLQVRVPRTVRGGVPLLSVEGKASSSSATALRLLRETPIATLLGGAADDWRLEGDLAVDLDLKIPLGEGEDRYRVEVGFDNNRFELVPLKLALESLKGRLRYDTASGLTSDNLKLKLLGEPATLKAVPTQQDNQFARFSFSGTLVLERLYQWLEQLQGQSSLIQLAREQITGVTPYRGGVVIERKGERVVSRTDILTQLQGVEVHLPAPLGKPPSTSQRLQVSVEEAGEMRIGWRYGSLLAGRVLSRDGRVPGGAITFGEGNPVLPPNPEAWVVGGRIEQLALEEWLEWSAPLQQSAPASPEVGVPLRIEKLQLGVLQAFDQQFEALEVEGELSAATKSLSIESPKLSGELSMTTPQAPLSVSLQRLYLGAQEVAPEPLPGEATPAAEPEVAPDPLQTLNPAELPSLNLSIADLRFGDVPWGNIATQVRPFEQGVRFNQVAGTVRGINLKGSLEWQYADGVHRTLTEGSLFSTDVGGVLESWGVTRYAEASKGAYDFDMQWPGSPAAFKVARLDGWVKGGMEKGRYLGGGQAGALRVFGVLNVNTITRRLQLDFSDLFSSGVAFDKTRIDLGFDGGLISTRSPARVEGPGSNFRLNGSVDLNQDLVDAELVVTLPLTANLPLLGLLLANPVVGGGLFVFDKLLGDQVQQFASVKYSIEGNANNPSVKVERLFGRQ